MRVPQLAHDVKVMADETAETDDKMRKLLDACSEAPFVIPVGKWKYGGRYDAAAKDMEKFFKMTFHERKAIMDKAGQGDEEYQVVVNFANRVAAKNSVTKKTCPLLLKQFLTVLDAQEKLTTESGTRTSVSSFLRLHACSLHLLPRFEHRDPRPVIRPDKVKRALLTRRVASDLRRIELSSRSLERGGFHEEGALRVHLSEGGARSEIRERGPAARDIAGEACGVEDAAEGHPEGPSQGGQRERQQRMITLAMTLRRRRVAG